MSYKNPKPCMYPGCKNLTSNGRYCSLHKFNTQKLRNTAEWKRIRQEVLEEQPYCVICGAIATEVDHIIPLPYGGSNKENLQGLCKSCHSKKTIKQVMR